MVILFGKTVVVVGREPDAKDHQFVLQAVQWHVEWTKAGRPQSNQGMR